MTLWITSFIFSNSIHLLVIRQGCRTPLEQVAPMNLEFSAEDRAFRAEVRQFLAERLPRDMAARTYAGFTPPSKQDLVD